MMKSVIKPGYEFDQLLVLGNIMLFLSYASSLFLP